MKDAVSEVNPHKSQPKMKISWEYYQHLVEKLSLMIPTGKYANIAGIPRGGLIPAVMLSHKMNLPVIPIESATDSTIIIDDICDTGNTLASNQYITMDGEPRIDVATLFLRKRSLHTPTYHAQELYGDEWLVFPYETTPV